MIDIEIQGGIVLAARLLTIPEKIGKAVARGAVRVGLGFVRHLKEQELSGLTLDARTGTGRRSVFYRVEADGNDIVVVVGSDLSKARYMRAQDRGAQLHAKTAAHLAVPLAAARTGKGVAKFSAREVIATPQGFGYVGTFVHNGIIFGKKGNGNAVPLFALKSTVQLKAVGYLAHTISEKQRWAAGELNKAAGEGLLE